MGLLVFSLKIFKKTSALVDLFHQPSARGMIFFVLAQVIGKVFDLCRQNGNLHLRRPRIVLVGLEFLNEVLFLSSGKHRGVHAQFQASGAHPEPRRASLSYWRKVTK